MGTLINWRIHNIHSDWRDNARNTITRIVGHAFRATGLFPRLYWATLRAACTSTTNVHSPCEIPEITQGSVPRYR
jgi:hypothetical protein